MTDRAARQRALQAEADAVARDLDLNRLLSGAGTPVRVGSSALGLMVWRDLDVTVVCERLDLAPVLAAANALASHARVREVQFRNDTGAWNTDANYPDGHYLGVRYRGEAGDDWKLDIWFVDEPDRQPDLRHLRDLAPRLDDETRAAILDVKEEWAGRPEYGRTVTSFDIYRAVLDDGVRSRADFRAWLDR